MTISQSLLPEFDQEMATTRKVLERCPESKFTFKPHAKSWDMATLATHLANIPYWGIITMQLDVFDYSPETYKEEPAETTADLLAKFDKDRTELRAAIEHAGDEDWNRMWTFTAGGATIFSLPKIVAMRTYVLNHSVHHRAQLALYLRLTDIPVPAMYGPSADESGG